MPAIISICGRKLRLKKPQGYPFPQTAFEDPPCLEDPASPTLPLGAQQILCFLLHPLDSCLKAFSRLRSALGLQAEQAGMLSLSPERALNPELHSTWPPEVPGEPRLPYPQHLPVNGVYTLTPSSSCLTSPPSHQYFLSSPPMRYPSLRNNYPKIQWLEITPILFRSQVCKSRIQADPVGRFFCSALTEARR